MAWANSARKPFCRRPALPPPGGGQAHLGFSRRPQVLPAPDGRQIDLVMEGRLAKILDHPESATPNALHDEINLAAIGAGKHLLPQRKTMSLTAAGGGSALAAAKAAGVAMPSASPQCNECGAGKMRAAQRGHRQGRPARYREDVVSQSV